MGCKECKKTHLPDQVCQLEQAEIIKKSLHFDVENGKYTASYPMNTNLAQLEENKQPCLRMMKSLETKLKKENLVEKFNDEVKDFMKRGVIKWTSDIPGINEMQKSYIPLTFT